MTLPDAVRVLVLGEGRPFHVLQRQDLRLLFPDDTERAFEAGLASLVEIGLLERVARGVYLNLAAEWPTDLITGLMIDALRPGHLNYLSYESALANAGSLSQQPFWCTVATTGNGGEYRTRYGNLLFRHTNRRRSEIVANTVVDERSGYLVAHPAMALDDLRRAVPALVPSIDQDEHSEIVREWGLHGSTPRTPGRMPTVPYASAVGATPPAEGSYGAC